MKEFKLPSGAVLKVGLSPFAVSKELYQAMLLEIKDIELKWSTDLDANFFKGIGCSLLSSKQFESKLWECFKKCTYNGEVINEETFESEKAREDYLEVCYSVARENIYPFTKTLMQRYSEVIAELLSSSRK